MDENCLLVWCPADGYFNDRLRGVVQCGLDRVQDDLSKYPRYGPAVASSDILGPIALDFDNGHSSAFNMSNFFEGGALSGTDMVSLAVHRCFHRAHTQQLDPSSVYGSPYSDVSPSIRVSPFQSFPCSYLILIPLIG